MSISPGLCSITFRSLTTDEVLQAALRAGVEGIEWGADGHVPPGGGPAVEALRVRCRDAGVEIVSYGSYLGFAPAEATGETGIIEAVLDSAEALGAPMVRIWTELGVGSASPNDDRRRVTERTARFVDAIASRGLIAALEFHPYTLTESAASANELLTTLARPNLRAHWQPDPALPADAALAELAQVTPHLAHVHTFFWGPTGIDDRHPLADGADLWPPAFELADRAGAQLPGRRFALCEYVRDDDPEQLVADVNVLRRWLDALPDTTHVGAP